ADECSAEDLFYRGRPANGLQTHSAASGMKGWGLLAVVGGEVLLGLGHRADRHIGHGTIGDRDFLLVIAANIDVALVGGQVLRSGSTCADGHIGDSAVLYSDLLVVVALDFHF